MKVPARPSAVLAAGLVAAFGGATLGRSAEPRSEARSSVTLRSAASFDEIAEPTRRSAALFAEAGKVLQHQRCVNCHPATDRPLQGDARQPHEPRVRRGADGHGVAGMRCTTCHTGANFDPAGIPGNPHWHLAPASMAWEGLSLRQVCEQLKDKTRNGGRSLDKIVEHMRSDPLVGWAWAPGAGREPAPGTQADFAALVEAWVRTGAACPAS
jgi:hypothetical protein